MKAIVLYNGKAGNNTGKEMAEKITEFVQDELEFEDLLTIPDLAAYFKAHEPEQVYYLCGGDGTLNCLVNLVAEEDIPENLNYFPSGTGNDFYRDVTGSNKGEPIPVRKYLLNLPTVTIDGKSSKFLNGVGYGIDGYCCEEGDRQKAVSDKPVNYASIAIKGLLFKFKPANGKVTVDGETREYKKIWLAPTMNGRYYGGGMNATPAQDRLNPEHKVSVLVWHGSGKLPTLMAFPGIFKGEHIKHEKMMEVLVGKHVVVEFDKPIAAQIDGETVLGVTRVEVQTAD
ncbi:MAG: diacylglycerol kinase family protein [Clostridia bacterium]|nr:diacylglycerol kinase family protein [Clostridia bacterium]